jgi:hypothetical protein
MLDFITPIIFANCKNYEDPCYEIFSSFLLIPPSCVQMFFSATGPQTLSMDAFPNRKSTIPIQNNR